MSVCFFNPLPNSEYSDILIVEAFYNKFFSFKTFSLVKNTYLPTSLDNKG